jgi:hypothetical protein
MWRGKTRTLGVMAVTGDLIVLAFFVVIAVGAIAYGVFALNHERPAPVAADPALAYRRFSTHRPWLAAFWFPLPLALLYVGLGAMEKLYGPLSEHSIYPLWMLSIISLPWSILMALVFAVLGGTLFSGLRIEGWNLFAGSIVLAVLVGAYINGYVFFKWRSHE